MRIMLIIIWITAGFSMHRGYSTGLNDLRPVENWDHPAPGIWVTAIGNMEQELRYTDLAAERPLMESLDRLPENKFPFSDGEISFLKTVDNRIMIRVPTEKNEQLYGFGLQLDAVNVSKNVLNLNVDHWGTGGGRTHAPVPFYISSKGYGVFINTARFIKAYVQVGNRKDSPKNPTPVPSNGRKNVFRTPKVLFKVCWRRVYG